MALTMKTTTALLEALHDPACEQVWQEFDGRYRPVIIALALHLGLRHDEASEVAQETLSQFVRDYLAGRYDRGRGRLRSWILGIARHRILDVQRHRQRRRNWLGASAVLEVPDEARLTRIWQVESERIILQRALSELRERTRTSPRTMHAFELFALRGLPATEVSRQCEMEVAEVYRIKNRLTRRLREIVGELTEAFEETP